MKAGITLEQAQAEMNTIAARPPQQYPDVVVTGQILTQENSCG